MSDVAGHTAFDFVATSITGDVSPLDRYRGHVLLVVNVASRCGFTPQYRELEALYRQYRDRRFAVLGFPCNQFGGQEPGTPAQIQEFCAAEYDVSFPMFSRVDVNGPHAHPFFAFLKSQKRGWLGVKPITWNFTKFLVGRDGIVAERYGPTEPPSAIEPAILRALDRSP